MSGKTVISDLLREFDGYQVPVNTFEFNLLRVQNGLLDMQKAFDKDWSPIRSDAAIRAFKRIVERAGTVAKLSNPKTLFVANGMNYNAYFNNRFLEISEAYIKSLIDFEYESEWPYLSLNESGYKQFITRLTRTIFPKKIFLEKIYGAGNADFVKLTRGYLNNLYNVIAESTTKTFVLHNAVEPFYPMAGLNLFENAKAIIVDRDPRDIYASNFVRHGVHVPAAEVKRHWDLKLGITGAANIDVFIKRQKMIHDKIDTSLDTENVLRLNFEEIVLNYEDTLTKIYGFLGETSQAHIRKKEFFQPSLSEKNIGIWKKMSDQGAAEAIYYALPSYCYKN
ncbi:Sulfotransferase family protein [Hydrobacter penzbergensis]|uniref:Sulfotransferase family protein n=1 Tax=Hydrobacter penzbergensis TaxID=1235997 RepID=A0A8X8IGY1_9BACT|nr:sulfotransferase [Hydrobacter penzbergensis]SDW85805.1 Sulfotransferase family protein [Hydrobacter penzbergensis]